MWRVYLALCCLSLCASCAAPAPRQVPVTQYVCFMRPEWLQPTPVPPLKDQTVGQLIEETQQVREALASCNADKQSARLLIDKQKPPADSAGSTR